ncbi:hypothetical protein H0O02_00520 [Candidatus Micrarchaeota archaeon]|nr:hypothetical protein [Candidatus Micrarchaeota archaeon]
MKEHLPLLFLVFVSLAFALLLAGMLSQGRIKEETEQPPGECAMGQIGSCMKGPCNGTQACVNGTWGRCMVKTVCTPGVREPCIRDYCASAYKICNECGTGYGPCIGMNGS